MKSETKAAWFLVPIVIILGYAMTQFLINYLRPR